MGNKGGSFIQQHIEKAVLAIAGVIALWLLLTKVLITPNVVEYNNRKRTPAEIDQVILKQSETVAENMRGKPKPPREYTSRLDDYLNVFGQPITVDAAIWPKVPYSFGDDDYDGRKYSLPGSPVIAKPQVGYIRAAAYLPTEEVTPNTSYQNVEAEPNDIDLVTVGAELDIALLYKAFYDTFAGSIVKAEWRDPCLAAPVFAAVQLQRGEKNPDGSWTDWADVARLSIDNQRQMLDIIEKVSDLPRGGMRVRLLQYNNPSVMMNILQPMPFDIASTDDDWMPPSLREDFKKRFADQEAAKRREEMEERRRERDEKLENMRSNRRDRRESTRTTDTGRDTGRGAGGDMMTPGMGGGGSRTTRPRDRSRTDRTRSRDDSERDRLLQERRKQREDEKSLDAVYKKYEEILIDDETQLDKLEESLQFWAHDDTVQPGNTYRYRVRLGVFNPIADSLKLDSASRQAKDQVIIWSDFVETTQIDIPQRLYFFAKDIRETANTVSVEVFRYALGYWYGKLYTVESGEAIGRFDEPEKQKIEDDKQERRISIEDKNYIPDIVDFRTMAMMVDTVPVEDWSGGSSLRPRSYFSMYYSYDGKVIEEMPVQQRYWATDIQRLYSDIRSQSRKTRKPFRPRGQSIRSDMPSGTPGGQDMMGPEMMMPGMMMPGM